MKSGKGRLITDLGEIYTGEWLADQQNGQGKL